MKKMFLLSLLVPFWGIAQQSMSFMGLTQGLTGIENRRDILLRDGGPLIAGDRPVEEQLAKYYEEKLAELQYPDMDIALLFKRTSHVGRHYMFVQTYKNIPVHGAYLKVNLSHEGHLISAMNHLVNIENAEILVVTNPPQGATYIYTGDRLIPAIKTSRHGTETITDMNGNKIRTRDTRFYYQSDDTLVTGKVFSPDPVSTAGVIYGEDGTYKHFNDSDYALLNNERIDVTFPATLENGVFRLENTYAIIENLVTPDTIPVTSLVPEFNFTRKHHGFKEVMAFYHVTHMHDYIWSLGFTDLMHYKQRIDALSGTSENSSFEPDDSTLNFGTGGVPDAEDADVIVHEYTHAISFNINPSPDMVSERLAIEEGMCDVMAAVQSAKSTSFNWRLLFNFDAPNPIAPGNTRFWFGRSGQSTKTYLDYKNSPHSDCEIWSSCMLDIAQDIGHDTLIIIMLNAIYQMTPVTTMPEAAQIMIATDSLLYDKRHALTMGYYFVQRKFGDFPVGLADIRKSEIGNFSIFNSAGFAEGTGNAKIVSGNGKSFDLKIYDLAGKLISEQKDIRNSYEISTSLFRSGLYLLRINQSGMEHTMRLAKF